MGVHRAAVFNHQALTGVYRSPFSESQGADFHLQQLFFLLRAEQRRLCRIYRDNHIKGIE